MYDYDCMPCFLEDSYMKKQKKKEFNDLLIPIILVIAILPFITRLLQFDAGLSNYSWYSDYDIVTDFFSYYKSFAFLIISIVSIIILIPYFLLQRSQIKNMKPFIPIGVYSFFVLLSAIFSINQHFTMIGGMAHFESIFVLFGYVIMLIYTYQIQKEEKDYKSILKALIISLMLMSSIGFFQFIGKDLINFPLIQKLIIPREFWADYIGKISSRLSTNAISLTLFNPNYASVYLSMIIPFLIAVIAPFSEKTNEKVISGGTKSSQNNSLVPSKRERIICFVIVIVLILLLFKTYSRSGLVAMIISLLVIGYFRRKLLLNKWKQCCIFVAAGILVFVGVDFMNDFRYINKITGTVQSFFDDKDSKSLDEITTTKDGVSIRYNGEVNTVAFSKNAEGKETLAFKNEAGEDITNKYDSKTKTLRSDQFKNIKLYIKEIEDKNYILCKINNITWKFCKDEINGYVYINDFGKSDILKPVAQIGTKSMEDIGSGRGYIWSRSIPLLRNTLFIGKGPDTFLLTFPQSDYVGKANNCKTPYTLIEKPHSLYLMIGIQTGVISLIAFIAFYLIYMIKSFKLYRNNDLSSLKARMGLGCLVATLSFMISGLFNDSSLQTTPIFIVLLGLGMDINEKLSKSSVLPYSDRSCNDR